MNVQHTSTATPLIRRARPDEADAVALRIAVSFHHLPVSQWLVGDESERTWALRRYFQVIVQQVLNGGGHVDVIDDPALSGVAVWDHVRGEPLDEGGDYARRRRAAVGDRLLPRFEMLDETLAAHGKRGWHDHFLFLAVKQTGQGRGLGTALMRHHHAALDKTGTPAYLEAATASLVGVYQRHGYEAALPISLPGDPAREIPALPAAFHPMWRIPVQPGDLYRPDEH